MKPPNRNGNRKTINGNRYHKLGLSLGSALSKGPKRRQLRCAPPPPPKTNYGRRRTIRQLGRVRSAPGETETFQLAPRGESETFHLAPGCEIGLFHLALVRFPGYFWSAGPFFLFLSVALHCGEKLCFALLGFVRHAMLCYAILG